MAHHWPKELLIWHCAVNYDYIVSNSINSWLIGSRCILNGTHTNHFWANLAQASKVIKNSELHVHNFNSLISHPYTSIQVPSAQTCFNLLLLSNYSCEQELRNKVLIAIRYGCEGFEFSWCHVMSSWCHL